jgi:hypothetical protein
MLYPYNAEWEIGVSNFRKMTGEAGEHFIASLCNREHWVVAKAPETTKGFDLFVEINGKPKRIQVKTLNPRPNSNRASWQQWGFDYLAVVWYSDSDELVPENVWLIPKLKLRRSARFFNNSKAPLKREWYINISDLCDNYEKYRWFGL